VTGWKAPVRPDLSGAEPALDPFDASLRDHLADVIWTSAMTEPRSLQPHLGPSEVGIECERRLAYKVRETDPVNFTDPLRAMTGTGLHEVLAGYFRRLDGGSGRYLIEHRVTYRDISGSVDLYDRRRRIVIDWKTPLRAKVRKVPTDGPSHQYVVQAHIYGAALRAAGEDVERVGLVYLPPDSTLDQMQVWTRPLDMAVADEAIDRIVRIGTDGRPPAEVPATASRLCGWCPYYRPTSTDLNVACTGQAQGRKKP
jgi:hypothetical protein